MPVWRAIHGTRLSLHEARVKMKEFALAQDFAVLEWAKELFCEPPLCALVAIHDPEVVG
jgi:hypothetical protein